jgi:HlyD family secretion protein
MNKKLLAAPVILVAIVAGAWWVLHTNGEAPTRLELHGNVDIRQVELAFNASGRIAEVLVQEGDRVKKDQPLARLDTIRLQLTLTETEAMAAAQRSQVAKLKAGSRPEEIQQAAAQREAARAAADDARMIFERQQALVARHFVSQQLADSARYAFDAANEKLKAAEEAYRLVVLGPRKEDIAGAEATLAAQDAAVASLKHDIAEGELRAPDAGVIQNRILEPGDMASPQKSVFTLALTDPVWVRVYLPESALGRVPVGARATVTTDSHPDKPYAGWIGYVSPTAEFTPKTVETIELRSSLMYQARVFACNGGAEFRQGMPATVSIDFDQSPPAGPLCQQGR